MELCHQNSATSGKESCELMLGFIYGMTHCFLENEHIRLLEDVYQRKNKLELWINVIHHHMEDTLQETEHPIKFSSQVFISQLYSKIVLNGLNIVTDVREWATSTK